MTAAAKPLRARQYAILVVWGAGLWFAAALLVNWLGTIGALDKPWVVLTYALTVPGTVPFVYLTRVVAGLTKRQTALGIAAATASAAMLDGNALVWAPGLYGTAGTAGAAAILWGAGVGLVLGLAMNGDGHKA